MKASFAPRSEPWWPSCLLWLLQILVVLWLLVVPFFWHQPYLALSTPSCLVNTSTMAPSVFIRTLLDYRTHSGFLDLVDWVVDWVWMIREPQLSLPARAVRGHLPATHRWSSRGGISGQHLIVLGHDQLDLVLPRARALGLRLVVATYRPTAPSGTLNDPQEPSIPELPRGSILVHLSGLSRQYTGQDPSGLTKQLLTALHEQGIGDLASASVSLAGVVTFSPRFAVLAAAVAEAINVTWSQPPVRVVQDAADPSTRHGILTHSINVSIPPAVVVSQASQAADAVAQFRPRHLFATSLAPPYMSRIQASEPDLIDLITAPSSRSKVVHRTLVQVQPLGQLYRVVVAVDQGTPVLFEVAARMDKPRTSLILYPYLSPVDSATLRSVAETALHNLDLTQGIYHLDIFLNGHDAQLVALEPDGTAMASVDE